MRVFNRNFTLVVIGQIISLLGSAILRFALDLYVLDLTGRADIFAAVVAVSAVPGILFTPIGGAIADRFNRRNLMVIFDFISSLVVLVLFLLMGVGRMPVVVIGAFMVALSIVSSMYQPTVQSGVPVLVDEEQLAGANGIVSGVGALSGLLGPVMGGVLYGVIGIKALVIISCAAFFFSAVMEMFIRIPFVKRKTEMGAIPTLLADTKEGIGYVVKHNPIVLRIVLVAAALNLFLSPLFIIGVPYILRFTMHSSAAMYGVGLGIMEFATLVGALTAGIFMRKMKISALYRPLLMIAALILPMAAALLPMMLGLGYWPSFILFSAVGLVVMATVTMLSIFVITDVQKKTPNEMLGKVMSIILAASQIATPLGQIFYGGAFEAFHNMPYLPFVIGAAFTLLIGAAGKAVLKEGGKKIEGAYIHEKSY